MKEATITFTFEELRTLYFALNDYFLELTNASQTYGKGTGEEDIYHRNAYAVGRLQQRIFDAGLQVNPFNGAL